MIKKFILWYLKSKFEYLRRLEGSSRFDRAERQYMNENEDYWRGFADGINTVVGFLERTLDK